MAPTPLPGRGLSPETGAQRVPKGRPLAQLSRSHFQGGEATTEQTHREGRAGLVGKSGQAVFHGPSKGSAAPEMSTAACGPRAACAGGPRSRDPARHVMQPWGLKSRGRGAWHLAGLGERFSAQFSRGGEGHGQGARNTQRPSWCPPCPPPWGSSTVQGRPVLSEGSCPSSQQNGPYFQ